MHRHLRLLAIVTASLGLTCQPHKQPKRVDPPQPVASTHVTSPAPTTSTVTPSQAPALSRAFVALREMSEEAACALPIDTPTNARQGAKPFNAPEAHCDPQKEEPFCDTVDHAPQGANACFVSNDHIRSAEKKANILVKSPTVGPNDPWEGKAKPKYFERIDAHLHLDENEETMLLKNGFVVLDRLAYSNYAHAFHDIFQEELPLYVGADPILHAVFRATDAALEVAEQKRLVPALDKMLEKLRNQLAKSKGIYDDVTLDDLDVYVGLASKLGRQWSAQEKPLSAFGKDAAINALHDSIWKQEGLIPVEIFGRSRMIDVSQYTPRGHYATFATTLSLEAYFRAMTWLSRFEWNLVSRDSRSSHPDATPDKRDTPREARDALALADLFRQSGALKELSAFEEVYSAFGGAREDVGIPALLDLMDRHHIGPKDPDAPEKLKIAIGTNFKRTARTHFMPQGVKELPVISTVIGPRITSDIAPLEKLVHDATPNRFELGAADVGYVLGHDRAATYLQKDLQAFPQLKSNLDASRQTLAAHTQPSHDIHSSFLQSLLALAEPLTGTLPSFMKRDAYADLRLSSALVGYGQLRHTFVLLSGQGYDAYGCAIPDAYVEPLAPFYAALAEHVKHLQSIAGGGFDGLSRVLATLSAITKTELARGAPTKDQTQWLGMVAEHTPQGGYGDSGEPPKWTGWYFDMFEDRENGATKAADFIADYFTLTNLGKVAYLGTDGPRLGVFVVDVGGQPRAMVGPVAHGYEVKMPLANRLDDVQARTVENKESPFRKSFAAKPWTEPPLGLGVKIYHCSVEGKLEVRVLLAANTTPGPVSVTLLDHHADPLAPSSTREVRDEIVVFPFRFPNVVQAKKENKPEFDEPSFARRPLKYLVEAISIRIEDLQHAGLGKGSYDWFTSPSVFFGKGDGENMPLRHVGTSAEMVIGGAWHVPVAE